MIAAYDMLKNGVPLALILALAVQSAERGNS